jgi:hypothetical protein
MSNVAIRRALEIALDNITPALTTAWENASFKPINEVPYQLVNLLFATPENPAIGGSGSTTLSHQRGFLQVSLMYPLQAGTAAVDTRAALIKTTFKRGISLTNAGQVVVIRNTPEVTPGVRDNDRWRIAVKIPFYANVFA